MFLNTENRLSSPVLGYIFKEMRYDGKYISHKKQPETFQSLSIKLKTIKNFLIDANEFNAHKVSPDMEDVAGYKQFVQEVNAELHKASLGIEEFDYLLDVI
jgi:hypothetical protein